LKSSYEGKRRNPPAFLSANLEHLLGLQVGEIPSLGGAVFLGESHPGAEHRNFLLDLHADRLRRRTVGRCLRIVNGEVKETKAIRGAVAWKQVVRQGFFFGARR